MTCEFHVLVDNLSVSVWELPVSLSHFAPSKDYHDKQELDMSPDTDSLPLPQTHQARRMFCPGADIKCEDKNTSGGAGEFT